MPKTNIDGEYLSGGSNLLAIFPTTQVKEGEEPNQTTVIQAGTTAEFYFNLIEETKFDRNEGVLKTDLSQLEDSQDFYDFLDSRNTTSATGDIEKTELENGIKRGGDVSSIYDVAISYGAVTKGKKVKVTISYGSIDSNSGSFSQKYKTSSRPVAGFTGEKNSFKVIVPVACLDSNVIDSSTVTAPIEIPKDKSYIIKFLDAKV